jgi:hypothetical protein
MERAEWRTVRVDAVVVTVVFVFFALSWGLALMYQRL